MARAEENENITTLAATNIRGGRFPYKGIVMYALNAIRRAEIIDDKAADWSGNEKMKLKFYLYYSSVLYHLCKAVYTLYRILESEHSRMWSRIREESKQ